MQDFVVKEIGKLGYRDASKSLKPEELVKALTAAEDERLVALAAVEGARELERDASRQHCAARNRLNEATKRVDTLRKTLDEIVARGETL